MDWRILLSLFRGSGTWSTVSKVLVVAASIMSTIDKDKKGLDDELSGVMIDASEGLDAYESGDSNKTIRVLDGIISSLTSMRDRMMEEQENSLPFNPSTPQKFTPQQVKNELESPNK